MRQKVVVPPPQPEGIDIGEIDLALMQKYGKRTVIGLPRSNGSCSTYAVPFRDGCLVYVPTPIEQL